MSEQVTPGDNIQELIAEARKHAEGWVSDDDYPFRPFDQSERIRHWDVEDWRSLPPKEVAAREMSMAVWEEVHGHDCRLKCYPEFRCAVIESYGMDLVVRLTDALESRVSPVTREALIRAIRVPVRWQGETPEEYMLDEDDAGMVADAIMPLLSVSPPAEVEWEYGVEITYDWAESTPSIQWVENLASADRLMKDTPLWVHAPERIISKRRMRRVKAGPWVPVTPGEGKGQ